jgi:RNA polymerase sigma-70 factor (ECF subfamily)
MQAFVFFHKRSSFFLYFYDSNLTINTLLQKRRIESLTDIQLIDQYRLKGDKELVGVLFKRYTRFVFAVCIKYLRSRDESEDAVMGIFEKLFEDLKKHAVTNFKSWLYSVAKNYCLHELRNSKSKIINQHEVVNFSTPFMESSINLYHDNDSVLEQQIEYLEKELGNLSEEQRICIELFYLKDKSYQEVASITGYTLKQVKSYIQNGKRNLKISLSGHEQ